MRRLEGKTVLVAGAGGIGGELARRFASEGGRVVLGDLDKNAAQSVVDAIDAAGGQAIAARLDGADEGSFREVVELCETYFGGLDGAHLNFATFVDGDDSQSILDLPVEIFDETIRVNQRGYFLGTRAVLPALLRRGGGAVQYTSSVAAYRGGSSRVAYAMAKTAGHALMRHVAERFGRDGIRANTVAPGAIIHERLEAELPEEMKEGLLSAALIRSRLGRPEDIAGISALLMSDEGSFITGQVICIDGGVTLRP